ncbi:DUF680 domain-containing protein [Mesorhizobium sp. B2-4-17]|uniref:DUF680 domain-containing protein n=1 Tax=Mesorhizobium sp. B2-4-17 TaxID=2589932 RepID=UPI001127D058|nr:DUF680 domain-containing protein [Mesorhizobium sp. B2-4-17]TPK92375.1 DUF680 domain-containing protein [Mesorhizobium sp. B2-4-17]
MTRIVLGAAAMLVATATATAFAGSDHYGSEDVYKSPAHLSANIDNNFTASIRKHATHRQAGLKTNTIPATSQSWPEVGPEIWGR